MFDKANLAKNIEQIIAQWKDKPGALLPVLHEVQNLKGYIPANVVHQIADGLNLSRAEVHGVISFYHHFRTSPAGEYVIQICLAEACQSMGCHILEKHAKQRLDVDYHIPTKDHQFSIEPVYCLGNCALSPAIMVNKNVYGRVTPERFDEIVADYSEEKSA